MTARSAAVQWSTVVQLTSAADGGGVLHGARPIVAPGRSAVVGTGVVLECRRPARHHATSGSRSPPHLAVWLGVLPRLEAGVRPLAAAGRVGGGPARHRVAVAAHHHHRRAGVRVHRRAVHPVRTGAGPGGAPGHGPAAASAARWRSGATGATSPGCRPACACAVRWPCSRPPPTGSNMNAAGQFSADLRTQVSVVSGRHLLVRCRRRVVRGARLRARCVRARAARAGAHQQLLPAQAQDILRRVADRDPLTALDNRRTLPDVFHNVQPDGAAVLFFDLDGFKQINDLYRPRGRRPVPGALRRRPFASRSGPADAIVRYGGDEFLVVAPGMDAGRGDGARGVVAGAARRGARAPHRVLVRPGRTGGRRLAADVALHAADQAMYQVKKRA